MQMTIRERLEAFWSGERPDQIPYTTYYNEYRHRIGDPAWERLFQLGFGITWPVPSYKLTLLNTETREERYQEAGRVMRRHCFSTPVGEISATWMVGNHTDDWPVKYYLETPQDYRVMQYVVENTRVTPDYAHYTETAEALPAHCIPHPDVGNSPMLKIMLDLAGLEGFIVNLHEHPSELLGLYEALREHFHHICEITAGGPGRYVSNPESFSADTLGPKRFKAYVLSVYEENFPLLRSTGKIVGSHFDGKTASCKELIRTAPIDLIESLTPPPEGDQTLAEARRSWPDKLFWVNINVSAYRLPPEELKATVRELAAQAAPDGARLAFEISEDTPENWRQTVPLVLKALSEFAS